MSMLLSEGHAVAMIVSPHFHIRPKCYPADRNSRKRTTSLEKCITHHLADFYTQSLFHRKPGNIEYSYTECIMCSNSTHIVLLVAKNEASNLCHLGMASELRSSPSEQVLLRTGVFTLRGRTYLTPDNIN